VGKMWEVKTKNNRTLAFARVLSHLVEARGIEPLSKSTSQKLSPSAVIDLNLVSSDVQ